MTGASAAGFTGTANISIATVDDFKVDATNILTPNGDGKNDKWVVCNLDAYPNNEVQVLDRASRLVFQRRNYANDWGWYHQRSTTGERHLLLHTQDQRRSENG